MTAGVYRSSQLGLIDLLPKLVGSLIVNSTFTILNVTKAEFFPTQPPLFFFFCMHFKLINDMFCKKMFIRKSI